MRPACPCQAQAGTPPLLLPRPTADDSSHDNPILPESSSGHSPAFGILPRNEVQTGLFRSHFRPPAHARYVFKKYAPRNRRESVGMLPEVDSPRSTRKRTSRQIPHTAAAGSQRGLMNDISRRNKKGAEAISPSERHPPPRTPHRPDLTRKELFSFCMADFSPLRRFSSLRAQELLKEKAPSDEGAFFLQRDQFSHLPFT